MLDEILRTVTVYEGKLAEAQGVAN